VKPANRLGRGRLNGIGHAEQADDFVFRRHEHHRLALGAHGFGSWRGGSGIYAELFEKLAIP